MQTNNGRREKCNNIFIYFLREKKKGRTKRSISPKPEGLCAPHALKRESGELQAMVEVSSGGQGGPQAGNYLQFSQLLNMRNRLG